MARKAPIAELAKQEEPRLAVDTHLGDTLTNERTGASATARSVSTFRDVLRATDRSADPAAGGMARTSSLAIGNRLSRIIGDMPVYTVGPDEMRTLAQGRVKMQPGQEPAGFFDPKSGHIVVLDDAMRNAKEAAQLVLHEGTHGALYHAVETSAAARHVIEHLREMAEAAHVGAGGKVEDHYGLTNVHEFMAEAFGNDDFKRFLSTVKADDRLVRAFGLQSTGRTMWDAFVGAVRKILGVPPDQHSVFDAAMKVGGKLLDQAEARKTATAAPPARQQAAARANAGVIASGRAQSGADFLSRLASQRRERPLGSLLDDPLPGFPSIGAMRARPNALSDLAALLGGR